MHTDHAAPWSASFNGRDTRPLSRKTPPSDLPIHICSGTENTEHSAYQSRLQVTCHPGVKCDTVHSELIDLGSQETGVTLHWRYLQCEVEKPLLTFRDNFKKELKKYDHHIIDLRKQLASRYAGVEKARKALADRQKDLEVKTQQLDIKHMNKHEEDIKKARRKSTQAGDDLMHNVDLYNRAQSKWFEEMVTTSLELERLEVERVEMIRQNLRQYTTLRHETDMFNQSLFPGTLVYSSSALCFLSIYLTVEPVDQLLQSVDPAKDRELWVQEHKTGELRPVDMDI
ncbi:growth arrest-specific protein 7-like [Oncorhynchus masou masou]|uniref:growth arrest-specific protein 7-like n=1 Tax=Oncorhynchus masou masou TaxID=90313 RepID=UPI0031838198